MAFEPGEVVRLSEIGLKRWTDRRGNPTCNGIVVGLDRDRWIQVKWETGQQNAYDNENQLELVISKLAQTLGPGKTKDHFIRSEEWILYSGKRNDLDSE